MAQLMNTLQASGNGLLIILAFLLCFCGAFLSCLSISGTWLVLAATGLLAFVRQEPFPGMWTILVFLFLCIGVEILELAAGWIGVSKRGGSRLAGIMAVVGGFTGMGLGTLIPIPFIGSLVGMLAGSFVFAYAVEKERLKNSDDAANVAWGTIISRIIILLTKVCVTLAMIAVLVLGILFWN